MRRALALAAVVLATAATSAPAHAAPPTAAPPTEEARKEAKAFFDQGVKQAEAGDSKAALSSVRAAYAKAPSFRVLYNIGQLCSRLGDAACAVRAYRQYLDEGGASVPANRRQSVEAEMRGLSRTIGTIRVQATSSDVDVTVDDVPIGKTPIAAPYAVNGGSHKVVLAGKDKTVEKTVVVVAGETQTVTFDGAGKDDSSPTLSGSAANGSPSDEPQPSPPPATDTPPSRGVPVVPWVVTGVLAAGTVVTGILAASAFSSFKDKRNSYPVSRDDLDSAQGTARDLFLVTSILGAATIVSAGVAGYFTLTSSSSSKVGVAVGPGGVSLVGAMP